MTPCLSSTPARPRGSAAFAHGVGAHQARLHAAATELHALAQRAGVLLARLVQLRVGAEVHRRVHLQLEDLLSTSGGQQLLDLPVGGTG